MRDAAFRIFVFSQFRKHETMTLTFHEREYCKSDTGTSPRQGIPRRSSCPKTPGARAGRDPSVGSAAMSRICDDTYIVHHYLDQLPSQPPPSYPPKAEWDFPHQMRFTLWITTPIHLDTQRGLPDRSDSTPLNPDCQDCYARPRRPRRPASCRLPRRRIGLIYQGEYHLRTCCNLFCGRELYEPFRQPSIMESSLVERPECR
jgi:hypothetical protein